MEKDDKTEIGWKFLKSGTLCLETRNFFNAEGKTLQNKLRFIWTVWPGKMTDLSVLLMVEKMIPVPGAERKVKIIALETSWMSTVRNTKRRREF